MVFLGAGDSVCMSAVERAGSLFSGGTSCIVPAGTAHLCCTTQGKAITGNRESVFVGVCVWLRGADLCMCVTMSFPPQRSQERVRGERQQLVQEMLNGIKVCLSHSFSIS